MQRQFDTALGEMPDTVLDGMRSGEIPGVILAVSGGIDSMCMADLAIHSSLGIRFAVAHCNFHLRGGESDSDAAMVKEWCRNNGIKIYIADFDTAGYASSNSLSIEMAARELRYRWFGQLCSEYGFAGVLVAHNANDNAETLLLNLLRGTGLRGLAGMGRLSCLPCQPGSGRQEPSSVDTPGDMVPFLCRPMIGFTRKQIEGYVRSMNVRYREDSTNADTVYRRNSIRNEVFPLLEKINPSFIKTLNREMGYFSEADGLLRELVMSSARPEAPRVLREGETGEEVRIGIRSLMSFRHWPYLLYMYLEPYGFNSAVISAVEKLLKASMTDRATLAGKFFRSGTHIMVTASDAIVIRRLDMQDAVMSDAVCDGDGAVTVTGPGRYSLGNDAFTVEVRPRSSFVSLECPAGAVICDSSSLPFPFRCRRWRAGDWMRPLGMRGKKKVSDLFTDLKFDAFRKSSAVVAVQGDGYDGHIGAIVGVRIDDSLKVTGDTAYVLVLSLE